jgi:hypothetical protein
MRPGPKKYRPNGEISPNLVTLDGEEMLTMNLVQNDPLPRATEFTFSGHGAKVGCFKQS